jgi:hypothetical protein
MKFYKVTEVEFDFDYEDLTEDDKQSIVNDTKECLWDSPTEDQLVDIISDNTGWVVKSLSYDIV